MSATALAQRWDGRRSRLFFQLKPDSHNTKSLIAFLHALMRELRAPTPSSCSGTGSPRTRAYEPDGPRPRRVVLSVRPILSRDHAVEVVAHRETPITEAFSCIAPFTRPSNHLPPTVSGLQSPFFRFRPPSAVSNRRLAPPARRFSFPKTPALIITRRQP